MAIQYFGKATRLDPPVTVDGLVCGMAVQFFSKPSNQEVRRLVVSGVVHRVDDLGGGRKKVVARRGNQPSGYTRVFGPGNSAEVVYPCVAGGNVAYTTEPERVIYFANPMAYRGDDLRERAIPGDRFEYLQGSAKRAFLVTDAVAYGTAPASVNWSAETPSPIVTFPGLDSLTSLQGVGGSRFFLDEADTLFQSTGVVWNGSGGASGVATRRVFNGPDGSPDPDWFPPNASFASGSVAEYWIDPATHEVRLSSGLVALGALSVQLRWYIRGLSVDQLAWWQLVVLDQPSAAFSWGTADSFVGAFNETRADFDRGGSVEDSFAVFKGSGALLWRKDLDPGSVGVRLEWDATGAFTFWGKRISANAAWEAVAFTGFSLTFPFRLGLRRTGEGFEVSSSADGITWTVRASATIAGLEANCDGAIGLAGPALLCSGFVGATFLGQVQITGRMSTFRILDKTFVGEARSTRTSANAITEVRNLSAETAMTSSATRRRNTYRVDGSDLIFPVECAGDVVRVTYAADSSPASGPGRPPRTFDQTNFATFSEENPELSTTNVAQNRGNWHDHLLIEDPNNELAIVSGQAFEVFRDPVFDPRNPPAIHWDTRTGFPADPDAGLDWPTLSGADFRARWVEGLLLLSQSWLDSRPAGKPICFLAYGPRFVQRGGWSEDIWNEQKSAIEILDQVWSSPGSVGGGAASVSGYTELISVGATGYTCAGDGTQNWWKATGVGWGTNRRSFLGVAQDYSPFPYWNVLGDTPYLVDAAQRTRADRPEFFLECSNGDPGQPESLRDYRSNFEGYITGEFLYNIHPFLKLPVSFAGPVAPAGHWFLDGPGDPAPPFTNYFGSISVGPDYRLDGFGATYGFEGIPLGVASALRRMPEGTVIISAKARVKFSGFRRVEWSAEGSTGPYDHKALIPAPPWVRFQYSEGGVLIRSYEESEGITTVNYLTDELPPPARVGSVGFRLVGQRRNSKAIRLFNGTTLTQPASASHSLGAGLSVSEAADGEWTILELGNVLQAILDSRDSEFTDFQLWPSNNSVDPDDGVGSMASYLRSLFPTTSATLNTSDYFWAEDRAASGAFSWFGGLEFGSIFMRYRLPSGLTSEWTLPIFHPPAMPY